jgi:hypothetical protein
LVGVTRRVDGGGNMRGVLPHLLHFLHLPLRTDKTTRRLIWIELGSTKEEGTAAISWAVSWARKIVATTVGREKVKYFNAVLMVGATGIEPVTPPV